MKKAINKKALVISIISLAVAVVIAAVAWLSCYFYYRPSYLKSEKTFDIKSAPITDEITVMSYNLRYLSAKDCLKKSWFYRADLVIDIISEEKPDLIGFQEVTTTHAKYLTEHLSGYEFHIEYREKSPGKEATAIAYRADRFALKSEGHFWLSDAPEKMSKYSYSGNYRDANYVVLFDKTTEKEFVYYNTHLDSKNALAREKGMGVILEQMKKTNSLPTILTGDMNDFAESNMYEKAKDGGLNDAYALAKTRYEGNGSTWTDYGRVTLPRIDFCFLSAGIAVSDYKVNDRLIDGAYPSDHFPVIVKIKL